MPRRAHLDEQIERGGCERLSIDRLIAGTALRMDVSLLTNDERIRDSGLVRTVW